MNRGYIKLWRCSVDNDLYYLEPFTKRQAWQDLVLNANYKDWIINIRWNIINIKRWQIWWSEITMKEKRQRSRDKVRRFLGMLEIRQQIIQQKTALTTIITIVNYENYQWNDTTDKTTERQQKDNRQDTNNNDKNISSIEEVEKLSKQLKIIPPKEYIQIIKWMLELGYVMNNNITDLEKLIRWFDWNILLKIWTNPDWWLRYVEFKNIGFDWFSYHNMKKDKIKNHLSSLSTRIKNSQKRKK